MERISVETVNEAGWRNLHKIKHCGCTSCECRCPMMFTILKPPRQEMVSGAARLIEVSKQNCSPRSFGKVGNANGPISVPPLP